MLNRNAGRAYDGRVKENPSDNNKATAKVGEIIAKFKTGPDGAIQVANGTASIYK